ncbi:interferon-inducible GTPase 5-like [Symsagittifera roscoffensis]|uniref:interferon-inducible GTPase 5-like n=1 Tax=Symsagittifera roscoffensis TaxID=84072 RepID=UPI00307BB202
MDTELLLNDLNIDTAFVNQGVLHFNDKTTALNGDASLINEDQNAELNRWKDEIINIAIIGQSRQGKSSFINALCGENVAAVGDLAPTTMEIQKIVNKDFPNCVFWDLPGIDGIKFKRETNFDDIKLLENNYDVYIIVTKEMLGDGELFFAKELVTRGKLFYLVRTHVDEKVAKLVKKQKVSEDDAVTEIRKLLMTQLTDSGFDQELHKIFLVNVEEPSEAMQSFDMALFVETICRRGFASQTKASAFQFSIKIRGPQMVQEMYSQLRKRIKLVATASAAGGAHPIPGFGVIIDPKLIYDEIKLYLQKFNLTKISVAETEKKAGKERESIEKMVAAQLSSENGPIYFVREQNDWFISEENSYTQVFSHFRKCLQLSESAEVMITVALPIVGHLAAPGLSFVTTLLQLESILRSGFGGPEVDRR